MTKKIGRFEILDELGRGSQSVVYLALDPKLEREVAVKTLHFSQPDPKQNASLLDEARTVSKLAHPGIVTIFEAGEEDGDIFLVFEYVPGENLASLLHRLGSLSPAKAAHLMSEVQEAIHYAHMHGVIHRDLKPSNILIDENGYPKVMDFGISVHSGKGDSQAFTGTPAYMSPEYLSGHVISARGDIFAGGLILFEMLTGQRAIRGQGAAQVMRQIVKEGFVVPTETSGLDDQLAAIVMRATEYAPEKRYATALQFHQALEAYLLPAIATSDESSHSAVNFLLRRMRLKGDFPALSESVRAINSIIASDTESIARLSAFVLKDFSLTNKLLRLVNSAWYRPAGSDHISTVSRAIMLLGVNAVRNAAVAGLLFEHLQNKGNARTLKEEFLRVNMAGLLARSIARQLHYPDEEEPFICAIFHNLGRLLSQYYFPEESEAVRGLMLQKHLDEQVASREVLGVNFEDMGICIAEHWGFPPSIINSMRRMEAGQVPSGDAPEQRLHALAIFSNALCAAVSDIPAYGRENDNASLQRIAAQFGETIPLTEAELTQSLETAIAETVELAQIMQVNLQQSQFGRALCQFGQTPENSVEGTEMEMTRTILLEELALATGGTSAHGAQPPDAEAILLAGIQDIGNAMLMEGDPSDNILRIVLETMRRTMLFSRVILCTRDDGHKRMQGRFGFGQDADALARTFDFDLDFVPDVFHAATGKGADILIADINDPAIADRIPDWYRRNINAKSFILFPLTVRQQPLALIYADRDRDGEINIPKKELTLLRALRNQAVLALQVSEGRALKTSLLEGGQSADSAGLSY
ncbi:MAG: HDOD domain-containing protein [Zoogloeaceae bacterium]|jgi:serine/threonine protein kinase|nr:HDOD domain-containing protein [Zoogloeaceae bacterium]